MLCSPCGFSAQGAELMVLAGATETLKKATFVQLEVSIIQFNKGSPCWHDVDEFLRRHGFYFYDYADGFIHEVAFHTKAKAFFDGLYIKPTSAYIPTWLVDNNAEFCGSKEDGEVGHTISTAITPTSKQEPSGVSETLVMFFVFSAFLGGYIVGKINSSKQAKGLNKSV